MVRTPGCDKSGLRKGTWTSEEDAKLIAYVTKYGHWNWRQLPKFAGLKRCGKSCRLRWLNYLKPNIKRGNYSKEEEETIIKLHQSLGNKWAEIAAHLTGRTDNEIKNHWHTHLNKRALKMKQNQVDDNSETSQETCPKIVPDNYQVVLFPIPTSSEVSTITTESGTEANSVLALAAHNTTTTTTTTATSFEPFGEFNDSFWTEPFFSDIINTTTSYNYMESSLMDPEMILGSQLDTNLFCYNGLYGEQEDILYLQLW